MEAVRPRVLKVESARDAIDVDDFSSKVETVHELALHRAEVDLVESNAAARNELVLVHAFAADRERRCGELADKSSRLCLAEL